MIKSIRTDKTNIIFLSADNTYCLLYLKCFTWLKLSILNFDFLKMRKVNLSEIKLLAQD